MYLKYSTWPPWYDDSAMRVGVFLQRRAHDVLDCAVVAEVDDFGALRLDQAAHDVDRGIVAVEQAGRGDEAQRARSAWAALTTCLAGELMGTPRLQCDVSPDFSGWLRSEHVAARGVAPFHGRRP